MKNVEELDKIAKRYLEKLEKEIKSVQTKSIEKIDKTGDDLWEWRGGCRYVFKRNCPNCGGKGKGLIFKCGNCKGEGYVDDVMWGKVSLDIDSEGNIVGTRYPWR